MNLEVPNLDPISAASLRELEESAPKTTPAAIRNALARAAAELERQQRTAGDVVKLLEEALNLRVGQMDSHSRASEIDRAVKMAMRSAIQKLRG